MNGLSHNYDQTLWQALNVFYIYLSNVFSYYIFDLMEEDPCDGSSVV